LIFEGLTAAVGSAEAGAWTAVLCWAGFRVAVL
jgi:hypothetical protein